MTYFNYETAFQNPTKRSNYYALRAIARTSIAEFMECYIESNLMEDEHKTAGRVACLIALTVLEREAKCKSLHERLKDFKLQKSSATGLRGNQFSAEMSRGIEEGWDASLIKVLLGPSAVESHRVI